MPEGYSLTNTTAQGYVTTLTNSYTPEQTTVTVKKVWDDSNNVANIRPNSIQVQLYAGTEKVGNPVTLRGDSWEHTYTVDKYKGGEVIVYSFKELDENGNEVENNGKYNKYYNLAKYSTKNGTLIVTNTIDSDILKPNVETTKTSSIIECSQGLVGKDEDGNVITRAHEGDTIRYVITIKNNGEIPAKVSFEDTINDKLSVKEATAIITGSDATAPSVTKNGNKLSFTDYSLDAGATITITIDTLVKNLPNGIYQEVIDENTAIVKAKIGDEDEQKPSDETEYIVIKPHIETTKTSKITKCSRNMLEGTTVHAGDEIEYTITIENTGADYDTITSIVDSIPEYLTYKPNSLSVSVTSGEQMPQITMTENDRVLKLSSPYKLNAGKKITIKFKVTVDEMPEGEYTRTISKNIVQVNGKPTEDKDYTQEEPKVEASKTVNEEKVEYGEEVVYTINVENVSKTDIEAPVVISDPIPHGAEYVPGSITVNGEAVSDQGHFDASVGENGTITYETTLEHKGDVLTLKFKAKITEKTIGATVLNVATVNGEEEEAETKVVKRTKVTTISTKITPIDLVLVLDVSGSMKGDKISDLKEQAQHLVDKVFERETTSTVSVITYSSSATDKGTFKYSQRSSLATTISGLSADGGTNIYDALDKASSKVSSLTSDREKIVVFLTDGAATVPSSVYNSDIHSHDNHGDGYANNLKDPITSKAQELNGKAENIYAIGLGVNGLSTTDIGYAEKCEIANIEKTTIFDTTNHTFKITINNPTDEAITFTTVKTSISNIEEITELSNDGDISGRYNNNATWNDITIRANGSITLTGSYTPSTNFFGEERTPNAGSIDTTPDRICLTEGHKEQFNGKDLYSVTKNDSRGNQYHCITVQDYAKYVLSKISSDGTSMNVSQVSAAFDEIIKDLETSTNVYEVEEGSVLDIPETREITGKVTVTVGANSTEYTLDQLRAGVNGLKYTTGEGFKWTITGDTLLTEKLKLEYHVNE